MTKTLNRFALSTTALLTLSMHGAWAKVPTAEAERLGKDLTCMGAEKAANKDGSIPEYSGKWQGTPPGVDFKLSLIHI